MKNKMNEINQTLASRQDQQNFSKFNKLTKEKNVTKIIVNRKIMLKDLRHIKMAGKPPHNHKISNLDKLFLER